MMSRKTVAVTFLFIGLILGGSLHFIFNKPLNVSLSKAELKCFERVAINLKESKNNEDISFRAESDVCYALKNDKMLRYYTEKGKVYFILGGQVDDEWGVVCSSEEIGNPKTLGVANLYGIAGQNNCYLFDTMYWYSM